MPVPDLFVRTRIHVCARLPSEKKHHKHGKKHHVACKAEEHKEPNAMKQLARSSALMAPVVITAASSAAGRAPINRRFSADSGFFPFRFRWGVRKGRGHEQSSVKMSILSLWLGRISKETVGFLMRNRSFPKN